MLPDDQNGGALDIWAEGWARGDSAIIYRVLDDSFTFSGLHNLVPVDKRSFKMYWVGLRTSVEETGGPAAVRGTFASLKNKIRRKVFQIVSALSTLSLHRLKTRWLSQDTGR